MTTRRGTGKAGLARRGSARPTRTRRRILVVEDSPTQMERLRLVLQEAGHEVQTAPNGLAGLELVRSSPPDLVVSDVVMPEMDGYALCRALKSSLETQRIPFVLLTGQRTPADIIRGLEHGADNFITKPFEDEYLLERIRRIFEHLDQRAKGRFEMEVTIRVAGRELLLSADKQQIVELLFATSEELADANTQLEQSRRVIEEHARTLEEKVRERTEQLAKAEAAQRARARQQEAVARLGQSALEGAVSEALMDEAAAVAAATLGVEMAAILESLADGSLLLRAAFGLRPAEIGRARVEAGSRSLGGLTLASRRPVVVRDLAADDRFTPSRLLLDHGATSGVCVPIGFRDRPFGVLGAFARQPREFTGDDVHFLESVAHVLGATIEREAAHLALRESERKFRLVTETIDDVFWISEPGPRKIVYVSPAYEKLWGRSRESLYADPQSWLQAVHPEDRTWLADTLRNEHARGQTYEIEYRIGGAGSSRWIHERGYPVTGDNGTVQLMAGVSSDITERKQAEQALLLKTSALEAAANAIVITDREGHIEWLNPAFTSLTGYSLDEALGKTPRLIKSEVQGPEFHREMWDWILAGGIWRGNLWNRRKDGTLYDEEMTITPIRSSAGEISHFIAVKQDVTAQKELERTHRRLASIVESTSDLVATAAPGGDLLYLNPAGRRMLGLADGEDLAGRKLADFVAATAVEGVRGAGVAAAIRDGLWSGETALRARDGSEIPVSQVIVSHRDAAGAVISTSTIIRDLSQQKGLEQQLRQSQKMEAVGRLAGGVAHDFNNVLGVILGYGELLLRGEQLAAPHRGRVEQITRAAERAAGLTRQLLAFSRKQVLQPKLLDLNAVIREAEEMLHRIIGEDVRLVTRLASEVPIVKADPGQLGQVVLNLAVNARDAMPEGGTLLLETDAADLDPRYVRTHPEARTGLHAVFKVTDTGTGMDAATLAHLFEPFFTTKPEGKGTGLGLSTVYGIVKQSGGHVGVYSEVGHGSTFKVYIPAAEGSEPAERAEAPTAPATLRGEETVLVVEDEGSLRDLIEEVLVGAGYHVLAADSLDAALAAARSHAGPLPLLITDVIMPSGSGPAVAERVRAEHPELRVLYMSGYTNEAISRYGELQPGSAFLEKPFAPDALLRKVREVLDAR